ncbi:Mov34/MPN/PAD-1 family protein [Microbulbifer taiwanensis]|uniref:Mov34/MPN/PAD-1 family protein n=2 Tax=Microbulbifer taiwanensis TaxID=986746 RepID=A0ABW1YLR0_9GAMM
MYSYAQTKFWKTEAGGQLFSDAPESDMVHIDIVTGPYSSDRRTRCGFHPDLNIANRDRKENFLRGFHAVGLWHTHPEHTPSPSGTDRQTACEYLHAFNGEMDGFILVIIGNRGTPLNLCVWLSYTDPRKPWIKLDEI